MERASHVYWVLWFLLGFGIPETLGLIHGEFQTLSATWRWLRDSLPAGPSLVLSALMGAALLWLLAVHWIFSAIDKPGLDPYELMSILVGSLLGMAGAVLARKKKP